MPPFLFEVEDCVANGLLGVLTEGPFVVADDSGNDETLSREDAFGLAEVEEVFGGNAVEEFAVEVREVLALVIGEAVEGPTQEDSCGEPGWDGLLVPRAFEVGVFTLFVVPLALLVEPTVLDIEFAREGEFGVEIRAGSALGVGVAEFLLVGLDEVEVAVAGVCHN